MKGIVRLLIGGHVSNPVIFSSFTHESSETSINITARIAPMERQVVPADMWPCSNPIGSIDKSDLKRFIAWAEVKFDLPCLHDFLTAIPTAEVSSFDHRDG